MTPKQFIESKLQDRTLNGAEIQHYYKSMIYKLLREYAELKAREASERTKEKSLKSLRDLWQYRDWDDDLSNTMKEIEELEWKDIKPKGL